MPIVDAVAFEVGAWKAAFEFGSVAKTCDDLLLRFLGDLSKKLLTCKAARQHPDVMTFGYFCRPANIKRSISSLGKVEHRFGWGSILHIAPSNIPVNFAFSFVMGFLSGNSNIVRLPSKHYPQVDIILAAIDELLECPDYLSLQTRVLFVRTKRDSGLLDELVGQVNGVIVWGGDDTVSRFRELQKKPRCIEVYFPNRISSALLSAGHYVALNEEEKKKLARNFYNDTFLVDQNACSSPSMVLWLGNEIDIATAKSSFWQHLAYCLEDEYSLDPTARNDKYLDIMRLVEAYNGPIDLEQKNSDIWITTQEELKNKNMRFGVFLEIDVTDIADVQPFLRENEQTLTVLGCTAEEVFSTFGAGHNLVDRIVPVGRALDIGLQWDGKDLIAILSRRIQVG